MRALLRVVSVILTAGVGLILVALSSTLLTAWAEFPDVPEEDNLETMRQSYPWLDDLDQATADESIHSQRERRVDISEFEGSVTVQRQLISTREDPIIAAVASGELLMAPEAFAREVAFVGFRDVLDANAWESPPTTTPPTVSYEADGRATATTTSQIDVPGDQIVLSVFDNCAAGGCDVEASVRTEGYDIAGIDLSGDAAELEGSKYVPADPEFEVKALEPRSLDLALNGRPVEIVLTRAGSAAPVEETGPLGAVTSSSWWSTVKAVWRTLCSTLPWFLLLLLPAPRFIGVNIRRELWLLLSGLLLALYISNAGTVGYPLQMSLTEVVTGLGIGTPFVVFPHFHLAILLGVVWAPIVMLSLTNSRWVRASVVSYLVVLTLAGVAVQMLSSASGNVWIVGYAVAALGFALMVWVMSRYVSGIFIKALVVAAGTTTTIAGSALAASVTVAAAWAQGLGTLLFNALFVATLFMVPVSIVVRRFRDASRARALRVFRMLWAFTFLLGLWIAFPRQAPSFSITPVAAWDVYPLAAATVDAARVALFAALLVGLWIASQRAREGGLGTALPLVWAVGSIMLLRPETLFVGVPLAFLAGLGMLWAALSPPVPRSPEHHQVVQKVVRAGNSQRLLRGLTSNLEKKVAAGDMTAKAMQETLDEYRRDRRLPAVPEPAAEDASLRASTFGWGAAPAWQRGIMGAAIAALAGLPGFLQGLTSLSASLDARLNVPVLSASATIILVLRYPLYGLFFGYFLPWIVGDTAVRKSLAMFAVLGVSESIVLLLPYQQSGEVVGAFVSWMAQLFFICFALGVFFDWVTLRRAGFGLDALLDVHHTSRLVASAYAVSVSASAALTAAFATSAVGIITSKLEVN